VTVSSLTFRNFSSGNSTGVRVEVSFSGTSGVTTKMLDLFGFAVLRGSY
jgi:hypothetical protein